MKIEIISEDGSVLAQGSLPQISYNGTPNDEKIADQCRALFEVIPHDKKVKIKMSWNEYNDDGYVLYVPNALSKLPVGLLHQIDEIHLRDLNTRIEMHGPKWFIGVFDNLTEKLATMDHTMIMDMGNYGAIWKITNGPIEEIAKSVFKSDGHLKLKWDTNYCQNEYDRTLSTLDYISSHNKPK